MNSPSLSSEIRTYLLTGVESNRQQFSRIRQIADGLSSVEGESLQTLVTDRKSMSLADIAEDHGWNDRSD